MINYLDWYKENDKQQNGSKPGPKQQAINDWFESDEGKSCCKNDIFDDAEKELNIRLWKAFISGMHAQDTITKKNILDKLYDIIKTA